MNTDKVCVMKCESDTVDGQGLSQMNPIGLVDTTASNVNVNTSISVLKLLMSLNLVPVLATHFSFEPKSPPPDKNSAVC